MVTWLIALQQRQVVRRRNQATPRRQLMPVHHGEVTLSAPECKSKMMLQTPAITIRIDDNAVNGNQLKK
jgi:hypothetical protein